MSVHPKIEKLGHTILRRFESYGFWGGLSLGLLVGVLVSGPNFHDWALGTSLLVMAACTIGGGFIGFLAGPFVMGSTAGGPGLDGGDAGVSGGGDGGDGGGGGGD